jgi:transposase
MGRSRGGLTTKIHALVDARGLPIKLTLTAGQTHDMQAAPALIADLPDGAMLLADKGYDSDAIRQVAMARGAWANIPPKANRKDPINFSPFLYQGAKSHRALLQQDQTFPAHRDALRQKRTQLHGRAQTRFSPTVAARL